eukprot:14409097-Heterocapsa_arctica.AAC.1
MYARKAYADFLKETDMSILIKSKKIIDNSAEKFEAESELTETQASREFTTLELKRLVNYCVEPR